MDCREFGLLTKDFIYDDIKDNKIVMEYLNHAKSCRECYDELEVTYSMHRSLGDIMGPNGKDDSSDYVNELKEIGEYYNEIFIKERRGRILRIVVFIVILLIAVIAGICLALEI